MIPNRKQSHPTGPSARVRVAIYTRQSVATDLAFGSIDAQREAIEAFVASRKGESWAAVSTRYDDEGWSGKNTDRPAFQRLLADIDAGLLDAVACYKLDRISRSVADLTRFVALLDERGIDFCATTQSIDTSGSTGRLLLHILGSVAQFEREVISERTRDKIVATRRKGMWTGGTAILGFDVIDRALVANESEAATVNEIAAVYLRAGSLRAALRELERRGIRTKLRITKRGARIGGQLFSKSSLHNLLTNPLLIGKVPCGDAVFEGRHDAILDLSIWDAVQARLAENAAAPTAEWRNRYGALLRGIAHCGVCGSPMRHDIKRRHGRAYRYYTCSKLQAEGKDACPGSRAPAVDLEGFVVDRIRGLGREPAVFDAAIDAARAEVQTVRPALVAQVRRLAAERRRLTGERDGLLAAAAESPSHAAPALLRVAELNEEVSTLDARFEPAREELARLDTRPIDVSALRDHLEGFDSLFEQLTPPEQVRLVGLVIERVEIDVPRAAIRVAFRGAPPADSMKSTA